MTRQELDALLAEHVLVPARAEGPFRVMSWRTSISGRRAGQKTKAFAVVPSNFPYCLGVQISGWRHTLCPWTARLIRHLANSGRLPVASEQDLPI